MADAPMMPLDADAHLRDTMHLSAEEHGHYLRLLMIHWVSMPAGLLDDDKKIARMLGVTPARWRNKLKPVICDGRLYAVFDGKLHQKRLETEFQQVKNRREQLRRNASCGGRATALKYQQSGAANAAANGIADEQQMAQQMTQQKSSKCYADLDLDLDNTESNDQHKSTTSAHAREEPNPSRDPDRDTLLRRIRGFHISADNAKGLLAGAEAGGLSLAEVEAVLNSAAAQNADRDRLRKMVAETLEAKHPPQDWKGGISEHVHTGPAATWERVLLRLR